MKCHKDYPHKSTVYQKELTLNLIKESFRKLHLKRLKELKAKIKVKNSRLKKYMKR